jgi:hypothetical protein
LTIGSKERSVTVALVVSVLLLLVIVLAQRSHIVEQRRLREPCDRCGDQGSTHGFRGSGSLPEFFQDELHLCFTCREALAEWLEHLFMLRTERQFSFGRGALIREAEGVWGERAVELVALLLVAERDMDLAKRILTPSAFEKVRPWIQERLTLPADRTDPVPQERRSAPQASKLELSRFSGRVNT